MYYVYILRSQKDITRYYIGITPDIDVRLSSHNLQENTYSKRYSPWQIETYIAFQNKDLAHSFERYLKAGSGHAFLKKRFLPKLSEISS
jgi:putative endonuclease